MAETVLVVDDDPDIRTFVDIALSLAGYETAEASDGVEALERALETNPSIIVMDVMMPRMDGFEAVRNLRADGRLSHIPVILLTAKSQTPDKVAGFDAGADDYLTKPFDPNELVARVKATLRRAEDMRTIQPLTGLPGNTAIDKEIARRVDAKGPFVVLYADLNSFKAFNDHYGFARGDDVINQGASTIVEVAREFGGPETFVGHIGGDDFVVVTSVELWEQLAKAICERFDAVAPSLYDEDDRALGYIEVKDRQGVMRKYPLVAISIGVATTELRDFHHPSEVVTVATEMKSYAKSLVAEGGSNFAADRRTED